MILRIFYWLGEHAAPLLWWLGYWLALTLLGTMLGLFIFSRPGTPTWVGAALGAAVSTSFVAAAFIRSLRWLGWRGPATPCSSREPEWANVFIGMFAGPCLTVLLQAGVYWLAARAGVPVGQARLFSYALLLGAWLGIFAWIDLGAAGSRTTRTWLCFSGVTALAGIAALLASHGGTSAALLDLLVPTVWALLHLVLGARRPASRDDYLDGGGWRSDPDDPSGSPVPPPAPPPVRDPSGAMPLP